jgi:hypothetical protein
MYFKADPPQNPVELRVMLIIWSHRCEQESLRLLCESSCTRATHVRHCQLLTEIALHKKKNVCGDVDIHLVFAHEISGFCLHT